MNRIRKTWKQDCFFFELSNKSAPMENYKSHVTLESYDKVWFDEDNGITCKDVLVEISYIKKSLEFCDDTFLRTCLFDTLFQIFKMVEFIYQCSKDA